MTFSLIFQIIFIFGSTSLFLIILECLNDSWWCFSSSFSDFEDQRRFFFSQSCSILFKICDFSLLQSSHNWFWLWDFFSPIRSNSRVFSVCHPESINSGLFILSCQLSFSYLAGASFKYSLISLWSIRSHVSKSPQVSSFVFQIFPANCAFATFIFNSYGGPFKSSLPWSPYQFIRCFNPTGGSFDIFSSWRRIYPNPFFENK